MNPRKNMCVIFISLLVLMSAMLNCETSELHGEPTSVAATNTADTSQLQNRVETLEAAFRTIALAFLSQKNDLFAPINQILERDPAVRSILSLSTSNEVMANSASPSCSSSGTDSSSAASFLLHSLPHTMKGESEGHKQNANSNNAVDDLKGAVKCSLAHLVDINVINDNSQRFNQSRQVVASFLSQEEALEITWSMLPPECLKFTSGVWVRVYETRSERDLPKDENYISIPMKCIKINSDATSFSIIVYPLTSSSSEKGTCRISLANNLTQCHVYTVEIIPNYQSLRGKSLRTEIVIPSKQLNETKSFGILVFNWSSLKLTWADNSGCARQLTSLDFNVVLDNCNNNVVDDGERENVTFSIPRSCLKQQTKDGNLFSLVLPADNCPMEWKQFDSYRKNRLYTLSITSKYSDTWNGRPFSWKVFNRQTGHYPTNLDNVWRCGNEEDFFHGYRCYPMRNICVYLSQFNGRWFDCGDSKCEGGFQCGTGCLSKDVVCNGQCDCPNCSDEGYDCSYANTFDYLESPSGHFSSGILDKPSAEIHSNRVSSIVRKTTVWISVQRNHQIWLTFDKFITLESKHFVKVFDGPNSTSPLLLTHSGSTKPFPVRSSTNNLLVEFPSYYDKNFGIEAVYASVNMTDELFLPGCGGYVNDNGIISTPNYLSNAGMADCYWFIETKKNEDTILLRRNYLNDDASTATTAFSQPTMTIHDGWDLSGFVLYDGSLSKLQEKTVVYSISSKMMVHFKPPKVKENFQWSLVISKVSSSQCKVDLREETTDGTIKSPNYPMSYPRSSDCRWIINTKPGSKIQILFSVFETQERVDILSVFDGPTVHSPLLLEQSGSVSTPFVVSSSTNQMLIRFTSSDDKTSRSSLGFEGVYSSV